MIRFIIAIPFILIVLILACIFLLVTWILGACKPLAKDFFALRFAQWVFRVLLKIAGVKLTLKGKENMPKEPALYVANHRSIFDIFVMYIQCDSRTGFVAKNSIEKVPILRTWMRHLYCLFLDRKDIKQGLKVILQAIDYIKLGISICIFPEGTRNKEDGLSLLPFKEGSFKIALKTGCPIVPVAITYSTDVFENHIPLLKKTHVILEYGTPIDVKSLSRDEQKGIGATCQSLIQEMLHKNAELV